MIHNQSDISTQGSHLYSSYKIDRGKIKSNDSELYRLVQKTSAIVNSEEKRISHKTSGRSVKTGLVKSLFIGAAVLTGVGALFAGGYYYMAGRMRSDPAENTLLSGPSVPVMVNTTSRGVDISSSTTPGSILTDI